MKIKTILIPTSSLLFTLLATSCAGDRSEEEILNAKDTIQISVDVPKESPEYEIFFQVPSPGEMLSFIKSVGKRDKSKINILNATENINKYTDEKSKALNFGIYSTDLSYCSIFNLGSESIKYFKVVKQLGDQLGLSATIKPEILARIEKNIDNTDSLVVITDDLYYSSFGTLEEGKQGNVLALMVAGGWLESVYIAINMVDKFQKDNPVVQRIADQKYTLENLIQFLKKHEESSPDVKQVKADLEELMKSFNLLKEEKISNTTLKQEGSKKLIGGGINLVIDEKIFNEIKTKVLKLRNNYTQNQ